MVVAGVLPLSSKFRLEKPLKRSEPSPTVEEANMTGLAGVVVAMVVVTVDEIVAVVDVSVVVLANPPFSTHLFRTSWHSCLSFASPHKISSIRHSSFANLRPIPGVLESAAMATSPPLPPPSPPPLLSPRHAAPAAKHSASRSPEAEAV